MFKLKSIFVIIKFILKQPLSKGRGLNAINNFIRWQIFNKFFNSKLLIEWVDNAKFLISKGDTGLSGNLYCGFMEFEDMCFLLHYLREDDLFYDIGSNVGAYTILASAVKKCKSFSFEPIPETYEKFIDQIKINRIENLVDARNCGVGNKKEFLEFTIDLNCQNKVNKNPKNKKVQSIPVTTLDNEFKNSKSSFIKIDVEGYEKFVLDGGKNFFESPYLKAIIIELNGSGIEFGIRDEDLNQQIKNFGFTAVDYDPLTRSLKIKKGFNKKGNTIYLRNLKEASQRCKSANRFLVHTAGKKYI